MSYTPGPWTEIAMPTLAKDDDGSHTKFKIDENYRIIYAGGGYLAAGFGLTGLVKPADARLLAAAPDLYEALKEAVQFCPQGLAHRAVQALKKAVLPEGVAA